VKRKSKSLIKFFDELKVFTEDHRRRPKDTRKKSESDIQMAYQFIFLEYLKRHFQNAGYKDFDKKANNVLYWEGQHGTNVDKHSEVFASRNYPDFIIMEPYRIAVEYKQSESGSLIKQGIGQAMMHILNNEYDYVYLLFDDQTSNKLIKSAMQNEKEKLIANRIWSDFNICLHIL